MNKAALRRELLAQRSAMPNKQARDAALCQAIIVHPAFIQANEILGFFPIGTEPDIKSALEHALAQGKALYLPCCTPETRVMTFRRIHALNELVPGAHNIPEPPPYHLALSTKHLALALVPGLAFNEQGYRLGYGGGYYDRFLANFQGSTLGICYAAMIGEIPTGPHDYPVDVVATEGEQYGQQ
ncbi:MAG: 5-formyltetrahydrofolate cyclo-ligase [Oscillospiraceae bacterium]|nr:5-formyltetrahydrofolate cyclo-ligase [Oscillospiraceae bacterium]